MVKWRAVAFGLAVQSYRLTHKIAFGKLLGFIPLGINIQALLKYGFELLGLPVCYPNKRMRDIAGFKGFSGIRRYRTVNPIAVRLTGRSKSKH